MSDPQGCFRKGHRRWGGFGLSCVGWAGEESAGLVTGASRSPGGWPSVGTTPRAQDGGDQTSLRRSEGTLAGAHQPGEAKPWSPCQARPGLARSREETAQSSIQEHFLAQTPTRFTAMPRRTTAPPSPPPGFQEQELIMEVGACTLVFSSLGSGGWQAASLPSRASNCHLLDGRWGRWGGRGRTTLASSPSMLLHSSQPWDTVCTCRVSAAPTSKHWIGARPPAQAAECPQPGLPTRHHRPYTDPRVSDGWVPVPDARGSFLFIPSIKIAERLVISQEMDRRPS